MDSNQPFPLKIVQCTKMKLGIKAVVALIDEGERGEIYRNEVKLWHADSRKRFAEGCIMALNGNLSPKQSKEASERIDAWLRGKEEELKAWSERSEEVSACENGKPKEISPEERDEALALLQDPALLGRIQEDLTTMGIVDEERNKVLIYLIATSRLMPQGLAATIKGSSAAGKNYLVKTVARLMPEDGVRELTYISAKALYHVKEDWITNKLLICTEVVGKEQAEYVIRAFLSEGEITSAVTIKEKEGGSLKVKESKVKGPFAYVDTTTNFNIHPENATRVFELYLNETKDQTENIIRQQAKEASSESFEIKKKREEIQKAHQNAQRLLRSDLEIIIPFAKLIKFPPDDLRARRDFPKLLNLIKGMAFLHQYQRPIEHREDGKEYIEATLVDYELAYDMAKETFVETLDDLDSRSREALEVVKQQLEELVKLEGKKIEELKFDRDKVAQWCGKKKNKLNPVFKELEENEYFLDGEGNPIKSWGTEKRIYTLNQARISDTPIFADLTTPEELRQKWAEQHGEGDYLDWFDKLIQGIP